VTALEIIAQVRGWTRLPRFDPDWRGWRGHHFNAADVNLDLIRLVPRSLLLPLRIPFLGVPSFLEFRLENSRRRLSLETFFN
jgi:hypothetical protein